MSTVISVENVSKSYRLGMIGGATLKEDFSRWWAATRGKSDPLAKVDVAERARKIGEEFWALREVSFEVKSGEVLGVVGRNGAGKSTLLKILSQVTAPTSGEIKIRGRIASLLEVGTGFHPELSGRDNILLNGAILGMTRAEIRRKFDEIVAFSEIEEFIDTPVKRYSSGMYVRLAFAVAAHLEPEILIIDEVLAVGDTQFQRKCVGKMGEVSQEGRTVLFVSHNLTVVASLCDRAIFLEGGRKLMEGAPEHVIATYVNSGSELLGEVTWDVSDGRARSDRLRLLGTRILCRDQITADVQIDGSITIQYDFEVLKDGLSVTSSIHLLDKHNACVFVSGPPSQTLPAGRYQHSCIFPPNLLNDGMYSISIFLLIDTTVHDVVIHNAISFMVHETEEREEFLGQVIGCVRPKLEWIEKGLNGAAKFRG